jgi:TolA-binding protein
LATALVWNATFASASTRQLGTWENEIERFPDAVRGGPYFALGRALAHHKQPQQAAINLLHVPILYPQDRALAASALFDAGRALEQAGDADAAIRLYRELLLDYPQSRPAVEAQQRLKEIESTPAAGNNDGKAP